MPSAKFVFTILCLLGLVHTSALALPGTPAGVAVAAAMNSPSGTKSFAEWKSEKIHIAKEALMKMKVSPTLESHRELTQLQFNLEVAEALSVTDYIVLYLSNQPGGQAKFKEAAVQMTPEETAKIMEAYLKAMQSEQEQEKEAPRRSSAIDLLN